MQDQFCGFYRLRYLQCFVELSCSRSVKIRKFESPSVHCTRYTDGRALLGATPRIQPLQRINSGQHPEGGERGGGTVVATTCWLSTTPAPSMISCPNLQGLPGGFCLGKYLDEWNSKGFMYSHNTLGYL